MYLVSTCQTCFLLNFFTVIPDRDPIDRGPVITFACEHNYPVLANGGVAFTPTLGPLILNVFY